MGSKRRASNVSIKIFRKVGYNKPFFASNKPKGDVYVIALERGFLKKNVLESFRRVVTRGLNRLGKINIPLSFNTPFSAKPPGMRMGKGKGKVFKNISRVSSGTVLLEMRTYSADLAAKALSKASHKLPIRTAVRLRTSFFND
jgi:large subunit ribosomal protein L16